MANNQLSALNEIFNNNAENKKEILGLDFMEE